MYMLLIVYMKKKKNSLIWVCLNLPFYSVQKIAHRSSNYDAVAVADLNKKGWICWVLFYFIFLNFNQNGCLTR